MGTKGLRNAAIFTFLVSMAILLVGGYFIQGKVPPIPEKVVSGGSPVTDGAAILRGQDVYQRYGLMDHGSVWGHGSLRGMDFSAYTLHCMGELVREYLGSEEQPPRTPTRSCLRPRRNLDELERASRFEKSAPTATTRSRTPWN